MSRTYVKWILLTLFFVVLFFVASFCVYWFCFRECSFSENLEEDSSIENLIFLNPRHFIQDSNVLKNEFIPFYHVIFENPESYSLEIHKKLLENERYKPQYINLSWYEYNFPGTYLPFYAMKTLGGLYLNYNEILPKEVYSKILKIPGVTLFAKNGKIVDYAMASVRNEKFWDFAMKHSEKPLQEIYDFYDSKNEIQIIDL